MRNADAEDAKEGKLGHTHGLASMGIIAVPNW